MKKIYLLLLALPSCGTDLFVTNVDPRNPSQPDFVRLQGEQLYGVHCEACHGEQGKGTPISYQIQFPDVKLASFVTRSGRDENAFPVLMPGYSEEELSDDEMNSIIFFLRSSPLKPTTGQGLYTTYCGNCHGPNGDDGPIREEVPKVARTNSNDFFGITKQGHGSNPTGRKSYMPAYRSELSDAEIQLILDYAATL